MNLFNGSEEPECKRLRNHKLILQPPPCFNICGISRDIWWFKVILPSAVFLVDLISLKRTCKGFALFKPLRWLIKAKEDAAFGDPKCMPKEYWNAVRPCPYSQPLSFVGRCSTHKFVLFVEGYHTYPNKGRYYRLGVFSHKTKMHESLLTLKQEFRYCYDITEQSEGYIQVECPGAVFFAQGLSKEQIILIFRNINLSIRSDKLQ